MGLRSALKNFYVNNIKINQVRKCQQDYLVSLRNKHRIKVAFLGYSEGGGSDIFSELHALFSKDPRFEAISVIVPYTYGQKSEMIELINNSSFFLERKKIDFISGYDKESDSFVDIKKIINPDIVFMCYPYEWYPKEFKIESFMDKPVYSTFYGMGLLETAVEQINMPLNIYAYRVFLPSPMHIKFLKKQANHPSDNICNDFLGSLKLELFDLCDSSSSIWKNPEKKKVIWSPHHLYANFSNFNEMHNLMLELANKYKDDIDICFRPHPTLKDSLHTVAGWNRKTIDEYYNLWKSIDNCCYSVGDYHSTLLESDGMILDSLAFLAEYLYINKPALFVNNEKSKSIDFSPYGKAIKNITYNAYSNEGITEFIEDVIINGKDNLTDMRREFISKNMTPLYGGKPSDNIYNQVINDIFH